MPKIKKVPVKTEMKKETKRVVAHINGEAIKITTNKVKLEAKYLNNVLAVWPDSLPKPETVAELAAMGKDPEAATKLRVVKADLEISPRINKVSYSQHIDLTEPEQALVAVAKQYLIWDFKYLHYLEIKGEKVALKKDAEQQIKESHTIYANSPEAEALKQHLEAVAEALTKAGLKIPTFQSPTDAIWNMFHFKTQAGKMLVVPNSEQINQLAEKYM